jgi:hypothetical protein
MYVCFRLANFPSSFGATTLFFGDFDEKKNQAEQQQRDRKKGKVKKKLETFHPFCHHHRLI